MFATLRIFLVLGLTLLAFHAMLESRGGKRPFLAVIFLGVVPLMAAMVIQLGSRESERLGPLHRRHFSAQPTGHRHGNDDATAIPAPRALSSSGGNHLPSLGRRHVSGGCMAMVATPQNVGSETDQQSFPAGLTGSGVTPSAIFIVPVFVSLESRVACFGNDTRRNGDRVIATPIINHSVQNKPSDPVDFPSRALN